MLQRRPAQKMADAAELLGQVLPKIHTPVVTRWNSYDLTAVLTNISRVCPQLLFWEGVGKARSLVRVRILMLAFVLSLLLNRLLLSVPCSCYW